MCPRRVARNLIWSGLLLVAGGVVSAQTARTDVRIVTPSDIQWVPVPGYPPGYARMMLEGTAGDPGAHTYRVRMPAGFRVEPHTHPADEHITVLQGPWHLGLGESFDTSRLKALPAGSFVLIPAGTPHFISADNEAIIQVHGVGAVSMTFVSTKQERH